MPENTIKNGTSLYFAGKKVTLQPEEVVKMQPLTVAAMSANRLTAGNAASGVRAFPLRLDGDVAGIRKEKLDVNNQPIYDLSGRRVSVSSASSVSSVLPKGVYIQNGKKFVVK